MVNSNENFLEARSIIKQFGGVTALQDGNICIRKGKIGGLLGANGSGKTTLSRILTGIYQPTMGELFLEGACVKIESPSHAANNGIIMIHQYLSLIPELTVWQNVCLGHEEKDRLGFLKNGKAKNLVKRIIWKFKVDIPIEEQVKNLSPAKKQIVEIIKALSQDPLLLILDEPTSALEHEEVESLFTVMRALKEENVSMMFTSHRMWEAMEICDYVTVFRNGSFVGEIDFQRDGKDEKKIVELITGKHVEQEKEIVRNITDESSEESLIELVDIELPGFGQRQHHANISFGIKKGEIVGISGLQGQGQEDLLLLLAGFIHPVGGWVKFQDDTVRFRSPRDAVKRGIVLVPGDRNEEGLFMQHDVLFNINFPYLATKDRRALINYQVLKKNSVDIIKRLSIQPPNGKAFVKNLSGGNQQKIVIGKWLLLELKVLLLSDPAKGVDVQAKNDLYNIVRELAARGTSVILYASDNKELISMCNRVFIMFEGSIVEELSGGQLKEEDLTAHSLRVRFIAGEADLAKSEEVEHVGR